MRANHDTGHQPLGVPDMYPSRDTGWAPPRDERTAAEDTLAEVMKDRVIRFDTQVYPLETLDWPADDGEHGSDYNLQPFWPINPADTVTVKIDEMKLTVFGVVFEGVGLWMVRIEPTENRISCRVTDAEFLSEIANGLRLGMGDMIDASVRVTSTTSGTDGKVRHAYEVIKVHSLRDSTGSCSEPLFASPSWLP